MFLLDQTDRKRIIGRAGAPPTGLLGLSWCCSGAGGGPGGGAGALAVKAGRPGLPLEETGTPGDGSAALPRLYPPPPRTYLLLGLLGLQQGVPVCDGLARVGQHLVPVVPAQSLGVAADPHHSDDLIVADPAVAHTHTCTVNTCDPTPLLAHPLVMSEQHQGQLKVTQTLGVVWVLQVVVHDGDVQADVVHAVGRDVEDDGLVVGRVQRVLLGARLLLLQTPAVAYERNFDVGI